MRSAHPFSLLSFNISQENTNRKRAEGIPKEDRRDDISVTARAEAGTEDA